jgi:hypothetical protein
MLVARRSRFGVGCSHDAPSRIRRAASGWTSAKTRAATQRRLPTDSSDGDPSRSNLRPRSHVSVSTPARSSRRIASS